MKTEKTSPSQYDRVYSALDNRWVRFVGWTYDGMAEVCDSETLIPLPDLLHPTQLIWR